jgi:putative ABC transport system substrate-binding protein
MDRRRFLLASVGAVLAAPISAKAQQAGKMARVALVNTTSLVSEMSGPEPSNPPTRYLLKALGAAGWVEGRNLIFERRSAEGRFERFGDILRELIGLPCDVIVTTGSAMTAEALRVTSTVPIVFTGVDPITSGFVTALARPDRNITGTTGVGPQFEGKRLEVLREALPKTRRVAVLEQASSWGGAYGQGLRDGAAALGITLLYMESGPGDYSRAFDAITRERPDALYVGPGPYLLADRHRIVEFAVQNRLPLFGQGRDFTEAGALLTYSGNVSEFWRRTAGYVDRILRGAKAADLPIEQWTKFELVINLKTARALGVTIPPSLLLRADQVIQ